MKRQIIRIDESLCTGCGLCVPGCPEGALQIIDGKVRLVSDLFCDGLGACIGECPEGAIEIEEREAEPYDERKVMENVVAQGPAVVKAHLEHLSAHGQDEFLATARKYLTEKGLPDPTASGRGGEGAHHHGPSGGCPGSRAFAFSSPASGNAPAAAGPVPSQLSHWPVQLHLLSPRAPHYQGADVLLAADCVAFALGDFHSQFLKGRSLAIACPKLDSGQDVYLDKIVSLIDDARVNSLTVMTMEVPCCSGLLRLAVEATWRSTRRIPVRHVKVGIQGTVMSDEWL